MTFATPRFINFSTFKCMYDLKDKSKCAYQNMLTFIYIFALKSPNIGLCEQAAQAKIIALAEQNVSNREIAVKTSLNETLFEKIS